MKLSRTTKSKTQQEGESDNRNKKKFRVFRRSLSKPRKVIHHEEDSSKVHHEPRPSNPQRLSGNCDSKKFNENNNPVRMQDTPVKTDYRSVTTSTPPLPTPPDHRSPAAAGTSTRTRVSHPVTPPTVPPTPSPRPTKAGTSSWQQADTDMRTKAMQRLRNLGQEHSQHISKESIPPALLQSPIADEQDEVTPPKSTTPRGGRDQQIIDVVLGLHPCVPMETKTVIKEYASKPTSPTTVVSLEKLQKGGNRVFDFARRSMGKLMNCAADLKDLHEVDGLCAWEEENDIRVSRRGRSYQQHSYEEDEMEDCSLMEKEQGEGVSTAASVKQERVRNSMSGMRMDREIAQDSSGGGEDDDDDESLDRVMGKMNIAPCTVVPSEHEYHDEDSPKQKSRFRRKEKSTRGISNHGNVATGNYLQLEVTGATSGLTSLKSLTEGNSNRNVVSKYDLETANPTTSNVPFDERSDTFEPVDLYGSSAFDEKGRLPRKMDQQVQNPSRRVKDHGKVDEDWSVCTDER